MSKQIWNTNLSNKTNAMHSSRNTNARIGYLLSENGGEYENNKKNISNSKCVEFCRIAGALQRERTSNTHTTQYYLMVRFISITIIRV